MSASAPLNILATAATKKRKCQEADSLAAKACDLKGRISRFAEALRTDLGTFHIINILAEGEGGNYHNNYKTHFSLEQMHAFVFLHEKFCGKKMYRRCEAWTELVTAYRDRLAPHQPPLPVAEAAGAEVLSLPFSPAHSDADVLDAAAALRRVHERLAG